MMRGLIFGESTGYTPITDPRLLSRLEYVAQGRGVAERGRDTFLTELKHFSGDMSKIDKALLEEREKRIKAVGTSWLWEDDGSPSDRHLDLLMWGHSPELERLQEWAEANTSKRIFIREGVLNVWMPHRAPLLEAAITHAIPAIVHTDDAPVGMVKESKRAWLFKYQGGDWEVKQVVSADAQRLTGRGFVLQASKDIAYQVNLPSLAYFQRLAKRMGPPGNLAEDGVHVVGKDVKKGMGIVPEDEMDAFGINDRHPSGDGTMVGQRWKMPKSLWTQPGMVGSRLQRDESVFPSSARKMMGLDE